MKPVVRTTVLASFAFGAAGWAAKTTSSGAVYYENHILKSTAWERPVAPAAPPAGESQGCEFECLEQELEDEGWYDATVSRTRQIGVVVPALLLVSLHAFCRVGLRAFLVLSFVTHLVRVLLCLEAEPGNVSNASRVAAATRSFHGCCTGRVFFLPWHAVALSRLPPTPWVAL